MVLDQNASKTIQLGGTRLIYLLPGGQERQDMLRGSEAGALGCFIFYLSPGGWEEWGTLSGQEAGARG